MTAGECDDGPAVTLAHERFDAALDTVRSTLGGRHPLFLHGGDSPAEHYVPRSSPIDRDIQLGEFALATEQDAHAAMDAAHRAFPAWRATPASERVRLMRRVADVMEARVYEIAAALALEVEVVGDGVRRPQRRRVHWSC